MPSLHSIITSDCNRHLCSQSTFYFLLSAGGRKWFCSRHILFLTHTQECLLVSSTLAAGLARPDCSHSTFSTHKGQHVARMLSKHSKGALCFLLSAPGWMVGGLYSDFTKEQFILVIKRQQIDTRWTGIEEGGETTHGIQRSLFGFFRGSLCE